MAHPRHPPIEVTTPPPPTVLSTGDSIQELENEATYKYLGLNESDSISHTAMKENLEKEYQTRVRKVLKSDLNSSNKIKAINTWAMPSLTYGYGVIKWPRGGTQHGVQSKKFSGNSKISLQLHFNQKISAHFILRNLYMNIKYPETMQVKVRIASSEPRNISYTMFGVKKYHEDGFSFI